MSYIYNPSEKIVSFDVDDTLVMWEDPYTPGPDKERFVDPRDGEVLYFKIHKKHIQKLKGYFRSGYFVIVWSMSGGAWAKAIVDQLGLQDCVSFVSGKPQWLYDDMPLAEAFGQRKYFTDRIK